MDRDNRRTTCRRYTCGRYTSVGLLSMAAAFLAADRASASGFQLREQSSESLGTAYAGTTAKASVVSTIFYNPAGMTRLQGNQAAGSASWIAPVSKFQGTNTMANGTLTSGSQGGDAAKDALVPATFMMWDARPDLKLGVAVTSPFGLRTDYALDWVGRYHALESELTNFNVMTAAAYRVNEHLSIGGGVQIGYVKATLSQAINLGQFGDAIGQIRGHDYAVGFDIGLLYEFSPGTRVGVNWRSQMDYTLKGDASFGLPSAVPARVVAAANLRYTSATADLTTPDVVSAGIYHELTPQLALLADVAWTRWSVFDELRIKYQDGRPDSVTPENWHDSWFGAIGASYKLNERQTIHLGAAIDQTPVDDQHRTARIPDSNRYWLAGGFSWDLGKVQLHAGYAHLFADNGTINESTAAAGTLTGVYHSHVDIFTTSFVKKF